GHPHGGALRHENLLGQTTQMRALGDRCAIEQYPGWRAPGPAEAALVETDPGLARGTRPAPSAAGGQARHDMIADTERRGAGPGPPGPRAGPPQPRPRPRGGAAAAGDGRSRGWQR